MDSLVALSKDKNLYAELRKFVRVLVIALLATALGAALYAYAAPVLGSEKNGQSTGGDPIIAIAALLLALLLVGDSAWPAKRFHRVAALTTGFGVLYTIFSEWLSIAVRESWAYSEWMLVVPLIGTGLSPLLQWLVLPPHCLWWARHRVVVAAGAGRPQALQR